MDVPRPLLPNIKLFRKPADPSSKGSQDNINSVPPRVRAYAPPTPPPQPLKRIYTRTKSVARKSVARKSVGGKGLRIQIPAKKPPVEITPLPESTPEFSEQELDSSNSSDESSDSSEEERSSEKAKTNTKPVPYHGPTIKFSQERDDNAEKCFVVLERAFKTLPVVFLHIVSQNMRKGLQRKCNKQGFAWVYLDLIRNVWSTSVVKFGLKLNNEQYNFEGVIKAKQDDCKGYLMIKIQIEQNSWRVFKVLEVIRDDYDGDEDEDDQKMVENDAREDDARDVFTDEERPLKRSQGNEEEPNIPKMSIPGYIPKYVHHSADEIIILDSDEDETPENRKREYFEKHRDVILVKAAELLLLDEKELKNVYRTIEEKRIIPGIKARVREDTIKEMEQSFEQRMQQELEKKMEDLRAAKKLEMEALRGKLKEELKRERKEKKKLKGQNRLKRIREQMEDPTIQKKRLTDSFMPSEDSFIDNLLKGN